jgi:hypothetical protein
MGTLHDEQYIFLIISRSNFLRIRNISDKFAGKIKTHTSCYITIFFFQNRAVYEITWKNIVQPERPQMIIYGRIALHVEYLRLQTQTKHV